MMTDERGEDADRTAQRAWHAQEADKKRLWEASEAEKRREWEEQESARKRAVDLWCKHEDIAMHFNDLTMRLRLQALAGIGAASLIAGSIFTHQGQIDSKQIGGFLMAISFVWAAIFLLDNWYYQALLKAAVTSIVELEKYIPHAKLSSVVHKEVKGGSLVRWLFYGVVFALLLGGGICLTWRHDVAHVFHRSPAPPPTASSSP